MAKKKLKLKKKLQDMQTQFARMTTFDREGFSFYSRIFRIEVMWAQFRFLLEFGNARTSTSFSISVGLPILPRLMANAYHFAALMYARYYCGPKHPLGLRLYIPHCSTAKTVRWISIGDSDTPFFYHTSANCKGYPEQLISRWVATQSMLQMFAESRASRLKFVRSTKRPLNKRGR